MHISRLLFRTAICLLVSGSHLVAAGPGGYVELANLTPYEWKLKYTHSYHMDWKFPTTIPAGTTQEQYFEWWYDHGPNGDCGAEATYELVGSPEPASFTVQARQKKGKRIEIQFGDELSSIGNPIGSLITLGYTHDGTVLFVLAGNETSSYVSTNPPVAWMQATLPTIGSKSLREIAMLASHDAGMSQVTRGYGGVAHNTVTQSVHIYQQLIYGARWFDIRPVIRKGKWYTNHLTGSVGAFGRTIADIIKDVNHFTNENPGELIVLDLTHEMDRMKWKPRLTPEQWQKLYDLLYNGLDDIWAINPTGLPDDLSTVPIETFVQEGSKSAVFIRVPDHAPAFISTIQKRDTAIEYSTARSFSNTDQPSYLEKDQLSKLSLYRLSPTSRMHQSTWTITQRLAHILDFGNPATSIIADAVPAHRKLYSTIWNGLSSTTYPNLVEVDDIHDSQVAALCVAINRYFAMGNDLANLRVDGGRLAKRRMVMAFKGRGVDGVMEGYEWVGNRVEWFLKASWCSLKMGGKPCWTEVETETPAAKEKHVPLTRVMEVPSSEIEG
ncbi:PLC-like phosphodiesterase [Leptodontidium sp. MPI-SDFR-AT-0119]|nr:PLC-like phosphodiesterase [Leptodontidium sp. MPI-SDFR-AT-0119]